MGYTSTNRNKMVQVSEPHELGHENGLSVREFHRTSLEPQLLGEDTETEEEVEEHDVDGDEEEKEEERDDEVVEDDEDSFEAYKEEDDESVGWNQSRSNVLTKVMAWSTSRRLVLSGSGSQRPRRRSQRSQPLAVRLLRAERSVVGEEEEEDDDEELDEEGEFAG